VRGGHIYMNVSGTLRSNPGDNALTIVCLEGNGSRPSHSGNGWSTGGIMYTLNSTEVHCVSYAIDHVVTGGGKIVRQKENVGMKKLPQR